MNLIGKNLILKYNKKGEVCETRLLQVHQETSTYIKGWDVMKSGWRTFSKAKIEKSKVFGRFNR